MLLGLRRLFGLDLLLGLRRLLWLGSLLGLRLLLRLDGRHSGRRQLPGGLFVSRPAGAVVNAILERRAWLPGLGGSLAGQRVRKPAADVRLGRDGATRRDISQLILFEPPLVCVLVDRLRRRKRHLGLPRGLLAKSVLDRPVRLDRVTRSSLIRTTRRLVGLRREHSVWLSQTGKTLADIALA